jgi:hypothetical protein
MNPPSYPPRRKTPTWTFAIRRRGTNPNHHLWNNHGVWFIHYTLHSDLAVKQRVRFSLNTRNLDLARARRDAILANPPVV